MKHWLALAALICLGSTASMAAGTDVNDVTNSSSTLVVNVSSSALAGDVSQMDVSCVSNRKLIQIQNIDATANLFCDLIKANASSTQGHKITPGLYWDLKMACTDFNGIRQGVWCANDSGTVTKKAFVLQAGSN